MKNIIFYEIIKNLQRNPHLMRKLKVAAIIGFAGILITGGLLIWIGLSTVDYLTSKTKQVIVSTTKESSPLTKISIESCWGKARSLIAIEPWLIKPPLDNFKELKLACEEKVNDNKEASL